jgi:hypothetical protein
VSIRATPVSLYLRLSAFICVYLRLEIQAFVPSFLCCSNSCAFMLKLTCSAMKRVLILAVAMALAGCATPKDDDFHVTLVREAPDKAKLEIFRREEVIVTGPDGYTAEHKVTYSAALVGPGPTFVNPHFTDVPKEYHCVGSISLDLEHEMVSINMQRVVSKPGQPQETEDHPANGLHRIEKIKDETHGWWF